MGLLLVVGLVVMDAGECSTVEVSASPRFGFRPPPPRRGLERGAREKTREGGASAELFPPLLLPGGLEL